MMFFELIELGVRLIPLENCLVSNYMVYDTAKYNKQPKETIQLSFTSILITQVIRNTNNSLGHINTLRSDYDLVAAKKL